jgi:uncharacterized protein
MLPFLFGTDPFLCAQEKQSDEQQEKLLNAFLEAARKGDTAEIEACITNGASIDALGNEGFTALMLAVSEGQTNAIQTLLNHEARLDVRTPLGKTVFDLAKERNRREVLKFCLDQTKLQHRDIGTNHVESISMTISNKQTEDSKSLFTAILTGQVEAIKDLLSKGVDVNSKDENGKTALAVAVEKNNKDAVSTLLANHADVNEKSEDGDTPLILAARTGKTDLVKTLIKEGANSNISNNRGQNPVQAAAEEGYLDVVNEFIERDTENRDQQSIKSLSLSRNSLQKVSSSKPGFMRGMGASKDSTNPWVALFLLLSLAILGVLLFYIRKRWVLIVNKLEIMKEHVSELMFKSPLLMKILESLGQNMSREPALIRAIRKGKSGEELLKKLLERKVNIESENELGQTPLMVAVMLGYSPMTMLLLKAGANVNAATKAKVTPIMWAAMDGRFIEIQELSKAGAEVNAQDEDGSTAIMEAAKHGHLEIVKYLIAEKADLTLQTKLNKTALIYATEKKHADVVKVIQEKLGIADTSASIRTDAPKVKVKVSLGKAAS